jgi:predicted hydrolase (HD superfamily)
MSLTREEAWTHLCEWTKSESLRRHARAVEIVMLQAVRRYGSATDDPLVWGLAGLLHDADYEAWPEEHPRRIVAWLRDRNEDVIAQAISAHYTKWGVVPQSQLDKALLACDELTGFVVAAALVRPEGLATLGTKSVKKKLKDKAFAAKVDRGEIQAGAEALGVDLGQHIELVIAALCPFAAELGCAGTASRA